MPQKLSHEIITAAIAGFEAQKQRINSKIAELRNMLDHRRGAKAPKLHRKISAALADVGRYPDGNATALKAA